MNLQRETWKNLQIGDPVESVYLPGSSQPYRRDGIFASDGNFAFDRGLLAVEIAMVIVSLLGAIVTLGVMLLWGRRR